MKFIDAYRGVFGVAPLCAVINLPVSTYYDRKTRPVSARSSDDEVLAQRIEKIWVGSGQTYGAPRVHAALARDGVYVGRKRVERIMAEHGWRGAYLRRGWQTTTRGDPAGTPETAPDLVQRDFTADRPHALWVADITYVRTLQGFFYLLVTWNHSAEWIFSEGSHRRRGPDVDRVCDGVGVPEVACAGSV